MQTLRIASFDGTHLAANLYIPSPEYFPGKRPTVIFASSWLMNEWEYDQQARQFAKDGYLVLSYCTRGFGLSEGLVSVAGPDDLHDVSYLIDWLTSNNAVDADHIGMAGVSYGAGLSLLAAAEDPRIKTAVSLSGWGDLNQALAGNDSVRQVWVSLLVGSGTLLGRLSPEIYTQTDRLAHHTHVDELHAWARTRSPLSYVDKLNARQVPIFVGNSYEDNLFPPAQMRPLYEQLTGPKMFYMDRGIHAITAVPGLFGLPTEVWSDVHEWMDHWLKGKDTAIMHRDPVSFGTDQGRDYFKEFPRTSVRENQSLRLEPLNRLHKPAVSAENSLIDQVIHLVGGVDSGATTGIPIISDSADAVFHIPVLEPIAFINQAHAAVFLTQHLDRDSQLRGQPRATIHLQPHEGPLQMVAYLYDVDGFDVGTLITNGVMTHYEAHAEATTVQLDLAMIAYDIPAGHRLALAIDTRDPLYLDPSNGDMYSMEIGQSERAATTITLPLVD